MSNAMTYPVPVGRSKVTITSETVKGLMIRAGFFNQIPAKCGNCGSDDIVLNGTKNAGFEFYGALCRGCNHELKCGQRKEDGGLFWKLDDGWVPPYKKEGGGGRPPAGGGGGGGGGSPPKDFDDDDDVPF